PKNPLVALLVSASLCAFATPGLGDTITLSPRAFPLGKWVSGITFAGSSLWVSEAGQRTIAQLDSNNTVVRRITVGRLPKVMEFANDGAIYTLVETDQTIWQQFPKAAQGKSIGGLDGCASNLTSGNRFVWVLSSCQDRGGLLRIDPQSGGS